MTKTGRSVAIRVADIVISLDSSIDIERFRDIGFYKDFIVKTPSRCQCRLDVKIQPPPVLSGRSHIFNPLGNWQLFRRRGRNVIEIGPSPKNGIPENLTIFNSAYTKGISYQKTPTEVFRGFLSQFLIINLLSRRGGFLLHSAGVVSEGKGLCFIGRSGAGKSTLLRLFRPEVEREHLLNDDKLAIRFHRGRWRVFGTPWHGEFPVASPVGGDLKALFFIKQSKHNYLTKLSSGDTIRRLVEQALIPLWDEEASSRVLGHFESLIADTPSFELGFLPDKSAIELIKNAV